MPFALEKNGHLNKCSDWKLFLRLLSGCCALHDFRGNTLLQLGKRSDFMAADCAANESVVGVIFTEVKPVIATRGARKLDTHTEGTYIRSA